jgi:hypothetical protein
MWITQPSNWIGDQSSLISPDFSPRNRLPLLKCLKFCPETSSDLSRNRPERFDSGLVLQRCRADGAVQRRESGEMNGLV